MPDISLLIFKIFEMINKIIYFSIKNKAFVWLLTLGIIAGGIYSMTKVPVDAVPDITNNQVLVITTAPNLSTEDIEKFVTYQVELAVANLPDVEEIRSISRFGLSVVTIVFDDDAGTFLPRQLVSEALMEIKEKIPRGFGEPFMAPVSTGLGEIYQYTLEVQPGFENRYDDMTLRTIQDWIVKRQMTMLPGVVEVNSFGGRKKQYEIAINPGKLNNMGITIFDIFDALKKNNQNTGGAYIEKNHRANFIRGEGLMRSIKDIKNTFVKNIDGTPVFIRDVADVRFGNFMRYGGFTKDGKGEAVGGIVMMLKGANSNDVINNVKKRVSLIEKSLPEGIKIKPFLDRSKLIKSTTNTVAENLALGALIVIFILVLFLGNVRGGLIVAFTIPLSLLFAFIMMHVFGVWANLMSLGALDFGILIDGAVIIVESMIFYLNKKSLTGTKLTQGKKDEMAYKSASKMMNSAFFGQLIILIVFIPVLVLRGVEGKMFIPMALTFGFAVTGVMVLSLTFVPAISAVLLKPPATGKKSFGDKIIIKVENVYRYVIDWSLRKRKIVVALAIGLFVAAAVVFSGMGSEFIPQLDEGDFAMQLFLKPGTSLSETEKITTEIEKMVLEKFPDEVESIQSRIGVADLPMDPMPVDIADVFIILKPETQWKKVSSKKELTRQIKNIVALFPGINYEFSQPIEMRFNELLTGIREDIAIKLYGDDLNVLSAKAREIAGLVSNIRGVAGVKAEAIKGQPQITVKYNRNKMGQYGLDIAGVNTIIETAFSGGVAGKIYEGERMFDLVVRLDKTYRKDINDLKNLFIPLPGGNQIPLKEIAGISYQPGPMQISRDNTARRTYIGINVEERDIKSLVNEIRYVLDKKLKLPSGYYIRYGGAFENLRRATERLTLVVPIALFLIFILVYFAIKSLKQTLMIYMAIPFAAVGGIFSLYLRGMPFSISAGVGFIVLFGVAVLNGLVLVAGFNELKNNGKYDIAGIIKRGSVRRIRPVLLTASTDILGFLPMAVSTSAGAEVQRPLATVVIGGMLTSTLLTLVVLPVLYGWIETKKTKKTGFAPRHLLFFAVFAFGFLQNTEAQKTSFTLKQAVLRAKENHPTLKSAYLEVKKQKALKASIFDLGNTNIFTGKEERGNGDEGINNKIGIEQNGIDLFGIPAKINLANKKTGTSLSALILTEKTLIRDVSLAWYRALFAKKRLMLLKDLDTLYSNFEKAAKLKHKTQTSSEIEYLSASAKYKKLKVNLKMAESNFSAALKNLNGYLSVHEEIDVDGNDVKSEYEISVTGGLSGNPVLNYYKTRVELYKSVWMNEKTAFLPKIDISYKKQTVNGVPGYNAWQFGLSVPLLFFSQSGKTKASKIDCEIANQQYIQKSIEIDNEYKRLSGQYSAYWSLIKYYENEALPLADKQIKASWLAYKLGNISYFQFIQNVEAAVSVKQEYLKQEELLYELSVKIKYLTGN